MTLVMPDSTINIVIVSTIQLMSLPIKFYSTKLLYVCLLFPARFTNFDCCL